MISSFRRLSKSVVGTFILALFLVLILASFALQDISNVVSGGGFGMGSNTLAKAGGTEISDREMSAAMQRRLTQARQQNPAADYASLAGDFDPLLMSLIEDAAMREFADDQAMTLSKRLIDAEIAKLPGTRGLDGRFSQQAYQTFLQSQQITDADVRKLISAGLLQRMVLGPASLNARIPVGMATPYASMQLEAREGDIALIPASAFAAAVPAPSDADIAAFYRTNARRYMVPEQRILSIAKIGPANVAGVTPTDQEIAAYYKANQATYGGKSSRVISQAVVPSKAAADAIVARTRGGASFVDAVKPAGLSAADISVGPQDRAQFTRLTSDRVAAAAFTAAAGAIVGPIQSDLGWHVVRIDKIRTEAARSLAAARDEIVTKLGADKRKNALADLVTKVEDSIADGASFAEAARAGGLTVVRTPLITATGQSRTDPAYKLPAELAPALTAGFDLAQDDDPVVETLKGDAGYALVGAEQIASAAPAPLASIRERVVADWKAKQANDRARAVATAIAARVAKGTPLAAAVASAGTALPPPRKAALRRLELARMGGNIPPALNMLFALTQGGSRMVADPQGRGYIIVKLNRVTPGNALLQPGLVAQTARDFQDVAGSEYAEQLSKAIQADVGVKRNDKAIAATKRRILAGGS